jgi:Tol biopolymer transport system component
VLCTGIAASGVTAGAAVAPALQGGTGPVWSPDGTQIAYIGPQYQDGLNGTTGLNRVMVMSSADGSGAKTIASVKDGSSAIYQVRWASSTRIVFDINPDSLLRSVDVASRRVVPLGSDENVSLDGPGISFSLSRDGSELVANAATRQIEVMPTRGGAFRLLAKPKSASDAEASFSPDGRRVVFVRFQPPYDHGSPGSHPSLMVEATKGGSATALGVAGRWPQWSPDGRWIAVLAGSSRFRRLEIVPAAGGRPRVLAPHHVASFAWSPDSTTVAFIAGKQQYSPDSLGTIDLDGTVERFDIGSMPLSSAPPQWSPDGARIAFTGLDPSNTSRSRIYVIGAHGTGLVRRA